MLRQISISLLSGLFVVQLCSEGFAISEPIVLTFDDIEVFPRDYIPISGTTYAGLEWGTNSAPGLNGITGFWLIDDDSPDPSQGLVNAAGSHELSIRFPQKIDLQGMLVAAQGASHLSASGIRFHAYQDSRLIASTDWFRNLVRYQPEWLPIDLPRLDKLVIEADASAKAAEDGELWGAYRLDNFTYVQVPEPSTAALALFALIAALNLRNRRKWVAKE
jgi:hypothetical protein